MADPVSLDELKAHLNLSATTDESAAELTLHLQAAIKAIEKRIGPTVNREVTERLAATSGGRLVVGTVPLVSVTSATHATAGTAWLTADLHADPAGIIRTSSGARLSSGEYDVVYVAGWGTTAREDHKLAILYVAEHLWEMQQGSGVNGRPGLFGNDAPTGEQSAEYFYRGFALPRRALELIAGDEPVVFG